MKMCSDYNLSFFPRFNCTEFQTVDRVVHMNTVVNRNDCPLHPTFRVQLYIPSSSFHPSMHPSFLSFPPSHLPSLSPSFPSFWYPLHVWEENSRSFFFPKMNSNWVFVSHRFDKSIQFHLAAALCAGTPTTRSVEPVPSQSPLDGRLLGGRGLLCVLLTIAFPVLTAVPGNAHLEGMERRRCQWAAGAGWRGVSAFLSSLATTSRQPLRPRALQGTPWYSITDQMSLLEMCWGSLVSGDGETARVSDCVLFAFLFWKSIGRAMTTIGPKPN